MHHIIGEALAGWNISTNAAACAETAHAESALCFLHQTPGDLLLGGAKVVGSAQRRQRGALLQHGAVLLAASAGAPELSGIRELGGRQITAQDLAKAVCDVFAARTGWSLEASEWSESERSRIAELVRLKYSQDEWNSKR
jgi:lipoate-protein ligase A